MCCISPAPSFEGRKKHESIIALKGCCSCQERELWGSHLTLLPVDWCPSGQKLGLPEPTATIQHKDTWRDCRSEKCHPELGTCNRHSMGCGALIPQFLKFVTGSIATSDSRWVFFCLKGNFLPVVLSSSLNSPSWFQVIEMYSA